MLNTNLDSIGTSQKNNLLTHLYTFKESLNSRRKIRCSEGFLCKKMTCKHCKNIRRKYFIQQGVRHSFKNNLDTFLTISWMSLPEDNRWMKLCNVSRELSKICSGAAAGPFIRVISMGESKRTPHVHYLVSKKTYKKINTLARKKWKGLITIMPKGVTEGHLDGVLGYMFDRNFVPSHLNNDRPKGIRLLTASRPMRTGFPTRKRVGSQTKLVSTPVAAMEVGNA